MGQKTPHQFIVKTLMPGVSALVCANSIPTERLPALAKIMGKPSSPDAAASTEYEPARRLFVTENPDGTFAVLNDPSPLMPELSRIDAEKISVAIVRFDCQEDRKRFRKFLLFVDTTRHRYSGTEFTKDYFLKGQLDDITKSYTAPTIDARGFVAASSILTGNELSNSTFYRTKYPKKPNSNEESEPAQEKDELEERDRQKTEKNNSVKTTDEASNQTAEISIEKTVDATAGEPTEEKKPWSKLKSGEQGGLF